MRKYLRLCISTGFVFILGIAAAVTPEQENILAKAIDELVAIQAPTATVGIKIVSLNNGTCLYQKNSNNLLVPASTLKLVTAAAALYYLGPEYQFKTQLFVDGTITDGVLQGNLYLKLSGDPSLVTRDLEQLVLEIKKQGIKTITGTVALDTSAFDDIYWGPGWMWDEGSASYNSPVHACVINHNCVTVSVKPADSIGKVPTVFIEPAGACQLVSVHNKATTDDTPQGILRVQRDWQGHTDTLTIEGSVRAGDIPKSFQCTVEQPITYAAVLFKQLLEETGITVQGELMKNSVPEAARQLACHRSLPLSQLLHIMLKQSDNVYAECLCKTLGAYLHGSPGTWAKSSAVLNSFLSTVVGIKSDYTIVDGSGVSRYNLLSADQLVALLMWIPTQFNFSYEYIAALARAGQDGTLKQRMQDSKAQVRAKTGTMLGISSLAGYCRTATGELLAFACMLNGFVKPTQEYKSKFEDVLVQYLIAQV